MLSLVNSFTNIQNITLSETARLQFLHVSELYPNYYVSMPCTTRSYFTVDVDDLTAYVPESEPSFMENIRLEGWIVSKKNLAPRATTTKAPEFLDFEVHEKSGSNNSNGYFAFSVGEKEMFNFILRELNGLNGDDGDYIFFRITGLPLKNASLDPTIAETKNAWRIVDSEIRRISLSLLPAFQIPPLRPGLTTGVRSCTRPRCHSQDSSET